LPGQHSAGCVWQIFRARKRITAKAPPIPQKQEEWMPCCGFALTALGSVVCSHLSNLFSPASGWLAGRMVDWDVFSTPVMINSYVVGNGGWDGEGLVSFARGYGESYRPHGDSHLAALPAKSLRWPPFICCLTFRRHGSLVRHEMAPGKRLEGQMCTFVASGQWRVKQVVLRFVPVRRICGTQIKAAAKLAAMKKFSVARGETDNSGPFQYPSVSGTRRVSAAPCFAAFLLAIDICQEQARSLRCYSA
jgi:hypothetical protein